MMKMPETVEKKSEKKTAVTVTLLFIGITTIIRLQFNEIQRITGD